MSVEVMNRLMNGLCTNSKRVQEKGKEKGKSPYNPLKEKERRKESQTGSLKDSFLARPRARTRVRKAGLHGAGLLAAFRAWRIKTFGGDFDPVAKAVDEAVLAFSTSQPETDRALWLKIANRIGAPMFLQLMHFQLSRMGEIGDSPKSKPLRNPSSAFQSLLNAYDEEFRKGGAE